MPKRRIQWSAVVRRVQADAILVDCIRPSCPAGTSSGLISVSRTDRALLGRGR